MRYGGDGSPGKPGGREEAPIVPMRVPETVPSKTGKLCRSEGEDRGTKWTRRMPNSRWSHRRRRGGGCEYDGLILKGKENNV